MQFVLKLIQQLSQFTLKSKQIIVSICQINNTSKEKEKKTYKENKNFNETEINQNML